VRRWILEPMAPEAYSRLGEVLVNRGRERWADAEEALRFAMSLEPERGVHRARLGRLLRVRAMVSEDSAAAAALREEAKELLEAAIKESSRYGWPFLELTYLLLDMDGDMDRAEWCLHKAHKIFEGKHPGLSLALARIMARTRREEEAEQRIQRALKGKSNPHEAHFALGELYYSMGKVFAAASEFRDGDQLRPRGSSPSVSCTSCAWPRPPCSSRAARPSRSRRPPRSSALSAPCSRPPRPPVRSSTSPTAATPSCAAKAQAVVVSAPRWWRGPRRRAWWSRRSWSAGPGRPGG
jgi:tetratricopeptide (TPR) repeat protein